MVEGEVVIPKVWRSELPRVVLFLVCAVGSVYLSKLIPGSVIHGKLFSVGKESLYLSLPLFCLVPFAVLISGIYRIYNVRFSVDSKGIESRIGILSLSQIITRIRFEDIRSIETDQTLLERFFDIGTVAMGTAASAGIEMKLEGVAAPREIQRMIQNERDARQRLARKSEKESEREDEKISAG